jgi:formate dehydrogenase subunit delta
MANQIAAFFAPQGREKAVKGVADHLNRYWDPHMRARLLTIAPEHKATMDMEVAEALPRIKAHQGLCQRKVFRRVDVEKILRVVAIDERRLHILKYLVKRQLMLRSARVLQHGKRSRSPHGAERLNATRRSRHSTRRIGHRCNQAAGQICGQQRNIAGDREHQARANALGPEQAANDAAQR